MVIISTSLEEYLATTPCETSEEREPLSPHVVLSLIRFTHFSSVKRVERHVLG